MPSSTIDEKPKSKVTTKTKVKAKRSCKKCEKVYDSVKELNMHTLEEHESNFNHCKACNKKFRTKDMLDSHIQDSHKSTCPNETVPKMMSDEYSLPCEYCPLKFNSANHLKTHVMISHSERLISCDSCEVRMLDAEGMKVHIGKSHEDKEFETCDKCKETFENEGDLRNHIKDTHTPPPVYDETNPLNLEENCLSLSQEII